MFCQNQNYLNLGYTNIKDNNYVTNINFSKYLLNSLKHHFTSKLNLNYIRNVNHSFVYKYAERSDKSSYNILDSKIMYKKGLFIYVNNIFDEVYSETNLVPMPGISFLLKNAPEILKFELLYLKPSSVEVADSGFKFSLPIVVRSL